VRNAQHLQVGGKLLRIGQTKIVVELNPVGGAGNLHRIFRIARTNERQQQQTAGLLVLTLVM
jgi:hypothetical protein